MTKIIFVVRHAQSAEKQSGQTDYDRALTPAGIRTAGLLGDQLKLNSHLPDLIFSSSAARTRQTVALMNAALGVLHEHIYFSRDLYDGSPDAWYQLLRNPENSSKNIMIVGHNPFASSFVSSLLGKDLDLKPCECMGIEGDHPPASKMVFHFDPELYS